MADHDLAIENGLLSWDEAGRGPPIVLLIDALELPSPLLIGLSLGANVALEFAARGPGVARGLVLASPGLPGHIWSEECPPDAVARIVAEQGVDAARAFWIEHPIYRSLRASGANMTLRDLVHRYDGWHWLCDDPRLPAPDVAAALSDIITPALILSGGTDAADYRPIADRIACALPAGQLDRMSDSGHLMNVEDPPRFNAAVLAFASGLDQPHQERRHAT